MKEVIKIMKTKMNDMKDALFGKKPDIMKGPANWRRVFWSAGHEKSLRMLEGSREQGYEWW